MKKILHITAFAALLAALAGCSGNQLDTEQFTKETSLSSYGPQPVMRGGVLRFVGSHLEHVSQVVFPGAGAVTDITVAASGKHSEIRVTVPQEATTGYITLIADGAEIVTKTPISYSEPVTFTSFSPASAMAGDAVTITGDYLNNIRMVVFSDNVKVSEDAFTSHTRTTIVVAVPEAARTGVLALGDVDETKEENDGLMSNLIESGTVLTVGTPSVTAVSPSGAVKAGSSVTLTGSRLDLVDHISLEGAEVETFTRSGTASLTFEVPAEASDGDIVLVLKSGVEVKAGTLTTVIPSGLSAAPDPVKAGSALTVSGSDLDLVTVLQFPSADAYSFTYTDGQITVDSVSTKATAGDITLTLANGKTVAVAYTLVEPAFTEPSVDIMTGETFDITGSDLDLVVTVLLGEEDMAFTVSDDGTSLTVTTTAASKSGKMTMILDNGATYVTESELKVTSNAVVQVTELTQTDHTVTLKGSGFEQIDAITVGGQKVTSYTKRDAGEWVFALPEGLAAGDYAPVFVLFDGTEEECLLTVTVEGGSASETVLWTGAFDTKGWDGGIQDLKSYDWGSVGAGAVLRIYLTANVGESDWKLGLQNGNWSDFSVEGTDFYPAVSEVDTYKDITLTAAVLSAFAADGVIVKGNQITITKIVLR